MSRFDPTFTVTEGLAGDAALDASNAHDSVFLDKLPWNVEFLDAVERAMFAGHRTHGLIIVDLVAENACKHVFSGEAETAVAALCDGALGGSPAFERLVPIGGHSRAVWKSVTRAGTERTIAVIEPSVADTVGALHAAVPSVRTFTAKGLIQAFDAASAAFAARIVVINQGRGWMDFRRSDVEASADVTAEQTGVPLSTSLMWRMTK